MTQFEQFEPQFLYITAITQTYPMVITVEDEHNYIPGMLVHLSVPSSYGMVEANQLTGEILDVSDEELSVNIDAQNFSAFVAPNPSALPTPSQYATLAPAGCRNIYNTTTEPFHSS